MTTQSSEARKRREASEADELDESIKEGEDMFLRMVLANSAQFGRDLNERTDGNDIRRAFQNWSSVES